MRAPALIRCLLLAAPTLTLPAPAAAQSSQPQPSSTLSRPSGWLFSASLGVPTVSGSATPEMFTVAARWTQARPGRLGAEFSLGAMPRFLGEGIVVGFAGGGVGLPLQVSQRLLVIPSVGLTLAGAASGGGGESTTGVGAGLAAVTTSGPVGLRAGVTVHRFAAAEEPVVLWEIGLARVPWRR